MPFFIGHLGAYEPLASVSSSDLNLPKKNRWTICTTIGGAKTLKIYLLFGPTWLLKKRQDARPQVSNRTQAEFLYVEVRFYWERTTLVGHFQQPARVFLRLQPSQLDPATVARPENRP